MSTKTMWNILRTAGLSEAGTAGVIGNFKAESLLIPYNVEDRCPLSDTEYTKRVDDGRISRDEFIHDAYGYGLYQLTYYTRKAGYYDFAKSKGVSIGDESAQVEYCIKELKADYPTLYKYLCTTESVDDSSDKVCREFECPAVNNYELRRRYSREIYNNLHGSEVNDPDLSEATPVQSTPPTIRKGDKGLLVGMAQFCLITKGYDVGRFGAQHNGIDCDFGAVMEQAVEAFQKVQGLSPTGVIEAETWRRLYK